jgi:hypothetical protein
MRLIQFYAFLTTINTHFLNYFIHNVKYIPIKNYQNFT